ncbi:MAG: hypothetical protein GXP08_12790 [Gammaproteobacteria bacterium]|nr:hypothetical protein [Gammaproteobacteria bacterium]
MYLAGGAYHFEISPHRRHCQRGAISTIALLLLSTVVMMVLSVSIDIANTGVNDSLNQSDSVAALFLAESGLENALQRLGDGSGLTLCDNSLQNTQLLGKGRFTIAAGQTTDFDDATPLAANQCRIQVTGVTLGANTNTSRTIQAIADLGGGAGGINSDTASFANSDNTNSLVWNHTVTGVNRALLVGVTLRNNSAQTVSGVTYAGVSLSLVAVQSNGSSIRVELWQLVAPATGNNEIAVGLSANARVVAGAVSFTGVDQAMPIDAANSASGNSTTPTVNVTTLTPNAWLMDVQGEQNFTFALFAPNSGAGQALRWSALSGTCGGFFCQRVRGAGSTIGPQAVAGVVNMNWSWFWLPRRWAIVAVAIRPAVTANTRVMSWREIVS